MGDTGGTATQRWRHWCVCEVCCGWSVWLWRWCWRWWRVLCWWQWCRLVWGLGWPAPCCWWGSGEAGWHAQTRAHPAPSAARPSDRPSPLVGKAPEKNRDTQLRLRQASELSRQLESDWTWSYWGLEAAESVHMCSGVDYGSEECGFKSQLAIVFTVRIRYFLTVTESVSSVSTLQCFPAWESLRGCLNPVHTFVFLGKVLGCVIFRKKEKEGVRKWLVNADVM